MFWWSLTSYIVWVYTGVQIDMKKLLLIRKILLNLASIWAIFITGAIVMSYFDGFPLNWLDYFGYICLITMPLFIAFYSPILIKTFFIDIHLSNLQEIEEESLDWYEKTRQIHRQTYWLITKSWPYWLLCLFRLSWTRYCFILQCYFTFANL